MIEPGGPAPDFTLQDQDGSAVELSKLRGKWVVVEEATAAEARR